MPASSLHNHQPLHEHRPCSRPVKSPPAGLRNDTEISHSLYSNSSPNPLSFPRSSSRLGIPKQDANAATGPHHSVPQDIRRQPFQMPRSTTSNNAPVLHSAQLLSPQGSVVEQPTHLLTSYQQSLGAQNLNRSSSQCLLQPYQNQGILSQAHDFTMTGPIFHNVNITALNQFMKDFLKVTIPGAASDSSARFPPPRCHPGTRLAILERCLYFIANCKGQQKVRWVVGAAGVGKSAIMQSVTEYPDLPVVSHASVFFSVIGRNDGSKAILTLSYQFAAKSEPYRQLVEDEISRDPSLLQSSIPVQFNKFIVEPFLHHPQLNSAGRFLIILDGLDECSDPHTQQELLRLISDFCIQYPASPIVWLIASRPESHITSFFSRRNVTPTYEKEEVPIDSADARADVEQYLRHELMEIKEGSDSLDPEWPGEQDMWKLANAAGGLFAYAHTVIRYISDSSIGSPAAQLADVLNVIDNHPMPDVPREEHPMALLDALYARILSNVPAKVMMNTRKLLSALVSDWVEYLWINPPRSFILFCNWLGLTPDEVYAALNHLRSVLCVPRRDEAGQAMLGPFHKSFIDYISDFTRSGFSPDIRREAQQIKADCAFRILKEAPDGIAFGDTDYSAYHGTLVRGPGTGDKISLTWLADKKRGWTDNETRINMYKLAIAEVVAGVGFGDPNFQDDFCIHLLATRFQEFHSVFPHYQLRELAFVESRREEFMMRGILKQMSLRAIDVSNVVGTWGKAYEIRLRFHRPAMGVTNLSDRWDPSCTHERETDWEEGKGQNWVTNFRCRCRFCFCRLHCQLERMQIRFPDCTVPILLTSTGHHCVEFRFVDLEDGMSEWTYWFWYELTGKERVEGSRTIL